MESLRALDFIKIFKKKKNQPYPLEDILGLGDIAKFFLEHSISEEHFDIIGIAPRSIEPWFKGINNKSTLDVLWPDVAKCNIEHLSLKIEGVLSRDAELLNNMATSLGICPKYGELKKSYFAWAIAEQWKALGEGRGEAKKVIGEYYESKEEYEALRRSGDFGDASEGTFVKELYRAYGDAEKNPHFNANDCNASDIYSMDYKQRLEDFFAAEDYRRDILGLHGEMFGNFKRKIYQTVEAIARIEHKDGYQRMLKVMDRSLDCQFSNRYFNDIDDPRIEMRKKGACHHLVNDGKLIWVRRKSE